MDFSSTAAALDAVRRRVEDAPNGARDLLSSAEKADLAATHKTMDTTITKIRSMIAGVLDEHHAYEKMNPPPAYTTLRTGVRNAVAAVANLDPNEAFKKAVEGDLKTVADTTKKMSDSIANVTQDFNKILGLPGLANFSGTLESVPAVGILNSTIQYVAVTMDASGKATPNWQQLDKLPALPASGDTTSLFSYRGIFYCAIGKNVWSKTPRAAGDPELFKAAVNNWSQIFNPGWQSVGSVLPAGNSRGFIQFAQQSSDGTTLNAYVVRIASDGTLTYSGDPITANMKWSPLTVASGQAPNLIRAAYYANSIWGYDANSTLYELSPNFASGTGTYKVKTKTVLTNKITDLTAVDTGLVVAREDGNLYKLMTIPAKDEKSLITQQWKLWVMRNGVTSLGAASPGVMLDLKTLTVALKATYIDTQTNLFPYVNQIQACCASHGVYLENLLATAKKWQAASDAEKVIIASTEGTTTVQHAKFMGNLASTGLATANQMVVNMTRQTRSINSSIAMQLSMIDTKLAELKGSLTEAQAKEKALLAGLWASIGGVLVGLGLIVAGFFFPPAAPFLWAAGGFLVIGSIVAVGIVSSELGKIRASISQLQSAIADLTTQKTQLLAIQAAFQKLTSDYGDLNGFWLNMLGTADQIKNLEKLGAAILSDQPSIIAAQRFNQQIVDNLTAYVETLGRQGIVPPDEEFSPALVSFALQPSTGVSLASRVSSMEHRPQQQRSLQLAVVSELVGQATQQLSKGNKAGYLSTLKKAAELNAQIHTPFAAFLA
ncbi:hypothetical protein QBC38DRAFT_447875 [Podospora fimiseda]|uniref:Uncharacterized protein n=1 Tax=Podospora fimiseda TaxID=252190 RepID=A0AAN6YRZ8_9PEZI|nr:hypothetical protein QBC38DRAFT_447875 [Podospora fimiseda]